MLFSHRGTGGSSTFAAVPAEPLCRRALLKCLPAEKVLAAAGAERGGGGGA